MNSTEKLQDVESYRKLNESFDTSLIFHLGANAGFFSEFNNMVFAILYCLENRIQFKLYSKGGNLAYKYGWQDFFLPFCKETDFYFHKRYNRRAYQMKNARTWPSVALKMLTNSDFLTQDVWEKFRTRNFENSVFNIPELGIVDAPLPRAAKKIISLLWRYNSPAKSIISDLKDSLSIPSEYLSMHVRAGDKEKEKGLYEVEVYMHEAKKVSSLKDIFVLTDDYRLVNDLRNNFPVYNFSTLCHPSEAGYIHSEFLQLNKREKYNQLLKLLASIDLCASSQHFIGTYSSGPGNYLALRMGEEKCTGIDYNNWTLW